ncbi:SH3 domain-containing protein [Butyrivibrio sp. WCD3002]|uniref:SH3 domain-containing protein n=1 Tax=Butyrivibrio sp. WCD3002 TaxID=1280676 RepID=UPI000687BD2C|nr:SH3 domain-containing protein [Butyrivibrio sp. WCD3002]
MSHISIRQKNVTSFELTMLAASAIVMLILICASLLRPATTAQTPVVAEALEIEAVDEEKSYDVSKAVVMAKANDDEEAEEGLVSINNTPEEDIVIPDYSISVFESEKTLYTSDRVNVRTGAGTDYDKVAVLNRGVSVSALGETDNGWYQVLYDGEARYIKSDYLQEKVVPVVSNFVFAGDSRTVQMNQAVGKSGSVWVAQVGEGYDFFVNTAIPSIDANAGSGTAIIINFGVNDLHNVDKYIKKVNSKIDSWVSKGATVYYAAVLPVSDYPTITNADIEAFNSKLQSGLDSRVCYLDGYTFLQNNGFSTNDGLHYDYDTYRNLYAYYMSKISV